MFGYVAAREVGPGRPVDRLPLDPWSGRGRKSRRLAVTHRSPGSYLRVCLCFFMRVHAYVLSGAVKSSATTVAMRTFPEAAAFNGIRTH